MLKQFTMGVIAVSAVCAAPASAASFISTFENLPNGPAPGTFVIVDNADGWTGNPNIELQNNVAGTPARPPVGDGGDVFVELDTNGNSEMFRILGAGTYDLSYFYSPRPGVGFGSNGIQVFLDDVEINQISGVGLGSTAWSQINMGRFTVTGNQRLTFRANGTSDSLGGYIDNISVAAVPEPTTWALFILGFGIVGHTMRRRSHKVRDAKASLHFA